MYLSVRTALSRFCDVAIMILTFFIGLRFAFELLRANPATPFVDWIYRVSDVLIYPFRGIFANPTVVDGRVFDLVAMIALLAYGLIMYLVMYALDSLFRSTERSASWHTWRSA